ncbi:MAG: PQQ-binding-like beta-propeller repeat protein [Acidobacteriota bacterium]|nr:MAG: PQQ-binding-like beta-propeller repeat protein [Acidobacteriota bacterium]
MSTSLKIPPESQNTVSGNEETVGRGLFRVESLSSLRWIAAGGIGSLVLALCLYAETPPKKTEPSVSRSTSRGALTSDLLGSWPTFRGPGANGHAVQADPPLGWRLEDNRNVLWKAVVPKPGMSSPVIWGNRLFLTGADDVDRQVYCFDTDTGELLWQHSVESIPGSPDIDGLPNVLDMTGLAAPTATTNGRVVAAIFATGDLVGLSMEGKRIWARNLGIPSNPYGHASSLMSHGNLLFVQYDQEENSKLLAYDIASGDLAWQVERDVISWSSPLLIENNGRTELILSNCSSVDSYDPKTGKLLWHSNCLSGEVAPSAAYADGIVFVANEYSTTSAIDVGGHDSAPAILWQWEEVLPNAASPVANEDYLFLPSPYGIVTNLDAKSGTVIWEHEFDRGFYSSPILVNDRVYIIDLSGTMQVFKAADEFVLLATSELGEQTYATPAFVVDRIYIRGLSHLFCIGAKNPQQPLPEGK